jgi:prepilin-type N-terminal cleavage/methylation domain-containing protein
MNDREQGFTLIELIVSTSILGLVMSAIVASIFLGLQVSDDTQDRLNESHDARLLAAYFTVDGQSADGVRRDASTCTEGTAAGETPIVLFKWTEAGTAKAVSYFVSTVDTEKRLTRRACSGGAPQTEIPVVHRLGATDPSVSCVGSCPVTGTGTPAEVTLTVPEASGEFTFSLTAVRRTA